MRPIFSTCRVDVVGGALAITSPYDAQFVSALKAAVPSTDRQWDGASKRWLVSFNYGSHVQRLMQQFYNVTVILPNAPQRAQTNETRILDVRYVGAAKTREDGAETAFAWANGAWSVIFPKDVLLAWFGQTSRPGESNTLYGVLGVSQSADPSELKAAWKRLARTWHPDIAKEPGAKEQFQLIQEAYQILSDSVKRGKYNAGLAFEALSKAHNPRQVVSQNQWYSPLRCGLILCEGENRLGRFVVSKILQWVDITDTEGRVLVTTWAAGDDHFKETWVKP